jgi:aryl-alcohol dehydrogenase-like predicted oxidoreductase
MKAGKIRVIGASNFEAARLAEAAKISTAYGLPRYQSVQPHYNLLERTVFEGPLEAECQRQGLGVIPYWPLASGFLTGKYRSDSDLGKSIRGPVGAKKYLNSRGLAVLDALDRVSKTYNTTNATVALAWLLHRGSVTAPIVSVTNLKQLDEVLAAPLLALDPEAISALDRASTQDQDGDSRT